MKLSEIQTDNQMLTQPVEHGCDNLEVLGSIPTEWNFLA